MKEIIGCCGLVCSDCQIYEATQNDDHDLRSILYRRQIEWGHGDRFQILFGREYMPEDVHCDGCPVESERAFWYIENCQMRACCLGKSQKIAHTVSSIHARSCRASSTNHM